VRLRNQGDPILDVTRPAGVDARLQRDTIDLIGEMKDYIESPGRVVNLKSIPGLNAIREESDGLRALVSDPRSRESGNTMLSKEVTGGVLVMTGAGPRYLKPLGREPESPLEFVTVTLTLPTVLPAGVVA